MVPWTCIRGSIRRRANGRGQECALLRQDRENLAITVTVVGYSAVDATSGRFRNLDGEARRCGVVHGETGESGTPGPNSLYNVERTRGRSNVNRSE